MSRALLERKDRGHPDRAHLLRRGGRVTSLMAPRGRGLESHLSGTIAVQQARKTSSGDLVIWDSYLFRERLVTFEDRLREERDLDVSLGELARSSSGTVQHEKGSL